MTAQQGSVERGRMNEGRERPFVSVKFTPVGRTYRFLLPDLALDAEAAVGDAVVVNTAEGPAMGTVLRAIPSLAARKPPLAESDRVVRRATREDIVTRLKHQQREQDAQRICLMKIRERGLAMKLARVEQIFDGSRLDFLLHGRRARGFSRARARSGGALPRPHRDAADWRARRGQDARRLRFVRPPALLHDLAAVVRAGVDQDGEAAEAEPEPVEAVGHVRPVEVLSPLRTAERQGRETRRLCRRRRLRQLRQSHRSRRRVRFLRERRLWELRSLMPSPKPAIGITVGDPAGIGPEIARKAAADPRVLEVCTPVLYGPRADASFATGRVSAAAGQAAYDAIVAAVEDAQQGRIAAVATAPINKEAFAAARVPWRGHTELLAHLTGARRVAMMFYSDVLRVVARDGAHPAGRGPARADSPEPRRDDCPDRIRAAAIWLAVAAARARRPQPACG